MLVVNERHKVDYRAHIIYAAMTHTICGHVQRYVADVHTLGAHTQPQQHSVAFTGGLTREVDALIISHHCTHALFLSLLPAV